MNGKPGNYGTIDRAVQILEAFLPQNQDMGTVELSKKLGINKATVSRILRVMAMHQLLYQDPISKKYSLGNLAVSIGQAALGSLDERIVLVAKPHMEELGDRLEELIALEVVSGNSTVLASVTENQRSVKVSIPVGMRMPAHAAAGAKAILAFSPPERVDNFLRGELKAYTPNTITDRSILNRQLSEIKETGVAFDRGEIESDLYTAAVPVFDKDEIPVAAVVATAPFYREQEMMEKEKKEKVELLKETARKVSLSLKRLQGQG